MMDWIRKEHIFTLVLLVFGAALAIYAASCLLRSFSTQVLGVDEAIMVESSEKAGLFSYSTKLVVNATMVRHKIKAPYALKTGPGIARVNKDGDIFEPRDYLLLLGPLGFLLLGIAVTCAVPLVIPSEWRKGLRPGTDESLKRWISILSLSGLVLIAVYVMNARLLH